MTLKKIKVFKSIVIFALSALFLLVFYLALLGLYSIKAFQAVKKQNWQSASGYGKRIIALTGWVELISKENGQPSNRWLLPILSIRSGSQILVELERFSQSGQVLFRAILQNQAGVVQSQWPSFQDKGLKLLSQLDDFQSLASQMKLSSVMSFLGQEKTWNRSKNLIKTIPENNKLLRKGLESIPELIGLSDPGERTYTVLLQNDKELRPTGGFMGSYVQFRFQKGGLVDYTVQDIYVPDGAIIGHVNPPEPIQQAFQHGTWRLPNSNWDPDFPTAVGVIRWFLNKGGIKTGNGVAAVNFTVLEEIVKLIGEVNMPDYHITLSPDNFYTIVQHEVEREFFPGSTKKRDFLSHLTNSLLHQSQQINSDQALMMAVLAYRQAQQRNIQFYFDEAALQEFIKDLGWSGEIKSSQVVSESQDYLFIVDANLGANKANCCVDREVIQIVRPREDFYEVHLKIKYMNSSSAERPEPPEDWGGDYKNYVRILLPETAKILSVRTEAQLLPDKSIVMNPRPKQGLQSIGFFVNIPHLQQRQVEVNYTLPKQNEYQLFIQKQSGISYWHTVEYHALEGIQTKKQWVDKDQKIRFTESQN